MSMTRLLLTCGAALLLSSSLQAQTTIQVDVGRGPVDVYVPSSYDPAKRTPLLLLLHAIIFDGNIQEAYFKLRPEAEARGIIYAYPDGTLDSAGVRFWNATDACCDFFDSGVDDPGYVLDVIDAIERVLNVDPRRVWLSGHSNGGFLSHRLVCDAGERFAGLASLSGPSWKDGANCPSYEPISILHVHGTVDPIVFYGGGQWIGMPSPYPGAEDTTQWWATRNGCDPVDKSAPWIDLSSLVFGNETQVWRWPNGDLSTSVELWKMNLSQHSPIFNSTFAPRLMDFLEAHPKPGVGEGYCESLPNSSGRPARMDARGSTSITANDLTLRALALPQGAAGWFFHGASKDQVPFGSGFRCVRGAGLSVLLPAVADGTATAEHGFDLDAAYAAALGPGTTHHFQFVYRDDAAGSTGLTDGLAITFTL
jgi:polyhydroxybutyrate depolymerase